MVRKVITTKGTNKIKKTINQRSAASPYFLYLKGLEKYDVLEKEKKPSRITQF